MNFLGDAVYENGDSGASGVLHYPFRPGYLDPEEGVTPTLLAQFLSLVFLKEELSES